MATCDVAVTTGGLTLYELRAIGVSTIAVASISHEAAVVRAFSARGELIAGLTSWDETEFVAAVEAAVAT
jgi:spore coat polysaccharide biosynthesis predicted glycosyltransferase SpsG